MQEGSKMKRLEDNIREMRKDVDTQAAIIQGLDYPSNNAGVATATDRSSFALQVNVDFMYPHLPKAKSHALRKILTGVISHMSDMKMDDIITAMQESLRDLIWEDDIMGEFSKQRLLTGIGVQLRNPYSSYQLESKMINIDDLDRKRKADANIRRMRSKEDKEAVHFEELQQKFSYMSDINTLSYEELKQIDGYVDGLRGDVQL